MTLRFVNTALLIFILLLMLTGIYGIVWRMDGWVYEAHRIAAWALLGLLPWKAAISLRSLKRGVKPNFDRGMVIVISVLLTGAILFIFALGLMWAWQLGPRTLTIGLRQTVISWHWILALVVIPPFLVHVWRRWPKPKTGELLSRRSLLKLGGLAGVGAVGWWLAEILAAIRQDPEHPRGVSGSRLHGYFSGNQFPVTTGSGDGVERLDTETWTLEVKGAVERPLTLSYEQLLNIPPTSKIATIDCTVGWYSTQRWRGVALMDLLEMAGMEADAWSVRLRAVKGYSQSFPLAEAGDILLATHVGGETLAHRHGYPLRAVVPSRRGWFWIKWLGEVEALS